MTPSIAITGGGIAGLATAIALQQINLQPTVFEAAPIIREIGAGLGLAANAFQALHVLGLDKEVIAAGQDLGSFIIYNEKGKILSRTNGRLGKHGPENFAMHRAVLHSILLSHVNPQLIRTGTRITNIRQDEGRVQLQFENGTDQYFDYIIAADGIHSLIRKKLIPGSSARFAGYTCWRASIHNSNLQLRQSSETWSKKGRFGIVPIGADKLYWYACINTSANNELLKKYTVDDLKKHFSGFHEPVAKIIEQTKNDNLIWGDIMDLEPIHQLAFGNIVLVGDAAHATTPNLGQGACQGMEDAVVLAQEMKRTSDMASAFKVYEQRRLKRVHMIAARSRLLGKMAQSENALEIGIRNLMLKLMPEKMKEKEMKKILTVDF